MVEQNQGRRPGGRRLSGVLLLLLALGPAHSEPPAAVRSTSPVYSDDAWLTRDQHRRADRLVSLFENGTIEIAYGYAEALGDGRGYTVGRGFTTGTGDAYLVVELYSGLMAQRRGAVNPLARYIPVLRKLSQLAGDPGDARGRIDELTGFPEAWAQAADDPNNGDLFRKAQDEINAEMNYLPAMKLADAQGLRLPLSRAALYDAAVVHGMDPDPDGLPALVRRADEIFGRAASEDEKAWLRVFLEVRRQDLACAHDEKTRAEWAEGTRGRAETFTKLLEAGNLEFSGPIRVDSGIFEGDIP